MYVPKCPVRCQLAISIVREGVGNVAACIGFRDVDDLSVVVVSVIIADSAFVVKKNLPRHAVGGKETKGYSFLEGVKVDK